MGKLTAKDLANMLNNGTEDTITKQIEKQAKENGLVIVYGSSDDLIEFRGAIHDEGNCYDGGIVEFTKKGVLQNEEECEDAIQTLKENGYDVSSLKLSVNKINALWSPQEFEFENEFYENLSWAYETKIPYEKFLMLEDGLPYCIGIVFSINDLV